MKLVLEILGMILTIAWIQQILSQRAARRRENRRAYERREMAHIVGGPFKWWKEPPGDGPEGDH
jgi:hypothetical protein